MQFGIYYAYWEEEWQADYLPYISKAARLGFDTLEIACTPIPHMTKDAMIRLRETAADHGITLTAGHGPQASQNLASADPAVTRSAIAFYEDLLKRLDFLNIRTIGGGIYSYWPVDMSQLLDKEGDWGRSVRNVRTVARTAGDLGIRYCLEVLNRFEGYLLNTAAEGRRFVEEVGHDAVWLMLDTFHMNIEEDSFREAILTAGDKLGHFHTGEANRRVPGAGRLPWQEIAAALTEIGYDRAMVMEPFVRKGGQVGRDIRVWRDLSHGADTSALDLAAAKSVAFCRSLMELARQQTN